MSDKIYFTTINHPPAKNVKTIIRKLHIEYYNVVYRCGI